MDQKMLSPGSNSGEPLQKSSLLSKSAKGATVLIILQIGSRALTFGVNQLLLRCMTPELLGISTQLEVYSISVLFFARESLRVAIQRQTDVADNEALHKSTKKALKSMSQKDVAVRKTQEIVNLAYISIFFGFGFSILLAWAYLRSLRSAPAILATPYFTQALQLYGIAAFCELLAEPCFVVVQQKSEYQIRAAAESVATVLRCLVTCAFAVLATSEGKYGVLPFAFGQVTYGLVLLSIYVRQVRPVSKTDGFSLLARPIASNDDKEYIFTYFSRSLLALGTSLFVQGVVKHLLTQGDVILISYLASLQAQGIYALASNYGGLIARVVFQPIEETGRNYFSKLLSSIDGKPSETKIRSASENLHNLLRFYVLLSLVAVSLGPTVAPILLSLIAGSKWTSSGAGRVLAKYCYYIPLLAVNGITEAFVSSVATQSELNNQSLWMFTFSMAFASAGYLFLQVLGLGAEGLVWANMINMALRIAWSLTFVNNYFSRNGSRLDMMMMMPQASTIVVAVSSMTILAQVGIGFKGGLEEIIKGGLVSGISMILIVISERQFLLQFYRFVRRGQS